jgi:hypothetical protein
MDLERSARSRGRATVAPGSFAQVRSTGVLELELEAPAADDDLDGTRVRGRGGCVAADEGRRRSSTLIADDRPAAASPLDRGRRGVDPACFVARQSTRGRRLDNEDPRLG